MVLQQVLIFDGVGKLTGFFFFFFPFFFLLIRKISLSCIWELLAASDFFMRYEKQFHIPFRAPHQQQTGAAAPRSPWCQRLCKGLSGPQVSFEEAWCHDWSWRWDVLSCLEMGEVKVLKGTRRNSCRGLSETSFLPCTRRASSPCPLPHMVTHDIGDICLCCPTQVIWGGLEGGGAWWWSCCGRQRVLS